MSRLKLALETLDLRDWIDQYAKTTRVSDSEFVIKPCPECGDDKNRLYCNASKLVWICHRCQWGTGLGDVTILMAKVSGRALQDVRVELLQMVVPSVGDGFNEALEARFTNINDWNQDQDLSDLILPTILPGEAKFDSHTGQLVRKYAHARGLTDDLVELFSLRVAGELRGRTGPFLVFPVEYKGMTVAWQGRRVNAGNPKYISSEDIAHWFWPCNAKYMKTLQEKNEVVLVEGVFDAIGCILSGIPACCTFGKHITEKQIKLLKDHGIKNVVLGWDPGTFRDILKATDALTLSFGVKVMNLVPTDGDDKTDPGDVIQRPELADWLRAAYNAAVDAKGPDFWRWKLEQKLGDT